MVERLSLEDFCVRCQQREMPRNPLAQVRALARELAEGAAHGLWNIHFNYYAVLANDPHETPANRGEHAIYHYITERWQTLDNAPSIELLMRLNYIESLGTDAYGNTVALTRDAFDLIAEVDAATVFISYKRSESSAFALLLHDRLRQAGLDAFVDMQLRAGDNWQQQLRTTIQEADYFIVLLGKETLHSGVAIQEISWAIQADIPVIPVWHHGFQYETRAWTHILPDSVDHALTHNHTIRVMEENPLTYDMAMRELLNRFGIST